MKISIQRETLLTPLQIVNSVVERRQTLPILSNVLLSVHSGNLSMTGTDLEVEIQTNTSIDNAQDGETTLPGRKFMDICRALPENALIEINVEGDRATLKSGRSRFTLSTLSANEYPNIDTPASPFEFSISQKTLKKLIEQTQFSMAQQDVRYYLNGMMLEIANGSLTAVATDGHRLAVCQYEADISSTDTRQIILPRKAVTELSRLLEDSDSVIRIKLSENHIRIELPEVMFTSKLIDGKFPDYKQVIPSSTDKEMSCEREVLYQAFHRASVLSNEKYRGMRLFFSSNLIKATVHNPEQDEAEEELEVSYQGDEFEIGFNVSYLLDALNAIKSEQVVMKLTDSNHSCLLQGVDDPHSRYVVMPMRL